jgi:hypothetical protein
VVLLVDAVALESAGMLLDDVEACAFWQESAIFWKLATSKLSPLLVPVSWTVWPFSEPKSLVEPVNL